jgi:hypothetical protein
LSYKYSKIKVRLAGVSVFTRDFFATQSFHGIASGVKREIFNVSLRLVQPEVAWLFNGHRG